VPLAKEVQSVVETAKQEVEMAAKAYYAAKVPTVLVSNAMQHAQ
jgi:hypothetical protein